MRSIAHAENETSDQGPDVTILRIGQDLDLQASKVSNLSDAIEHIYVWDIEGTTFECASQNYLRGQSPSELITLYLMRTYEEYVKVCQSEPGKYEIQRVVGGLYHQTQFANQRVVRTPYLSDMYQRVDLNEVM